MLRFIILFFLFNVLFGGIQPHEDRIKTDENSMLLVKKTKDFSITGDGSADNWNRAEWVELTQRSNHANRLLTKLKILYSDTGMYVLFHNEDNILNATFDSHYEELWREDVVEVFLWTDESRPVYFEYELSPLNYELPLIVSNVEGELLHWIPFANSYHTESDRKTHHKTTIIGGEKESGAEIDGWIAEMFIPFKLLHPLENIEPVSGTTWRANFYRIDYDEGSSHWSWQPYRTNFHDYNNFGTILFE